MKKEILAAKVIGKGISSFSHFPPEQILNTKSMMSIRGGTGDGGSGGIIIPPPPKP